MAKKKIIKKEEVVIVNTDLKKIYLYKRNPLLLMPIPYKWVIDLNKINELKG